MKRVGLFFECMFCWRGIKYCAEDQIENVDAIFCQSFGLRSDGPGASNIFLATKILGIYRSRSLPLIIQKDCADAFPKNIKIDKIISHHEIKGRYLDSFEVSRQGAEFCKINGFNTVLVFAHPDHCWRVAKTLKKFGLKVLVANTVGTPYDPKSIQWWTRKRKYFIYREFLTRIFYFITGKI
jgi:hypothetical protein